jgi:hypothetical protein
MTPSQRHVLKFNPRRLFTGGVAGGFWDVSDRKTLFQDAAMTTPVAASDDPVGCIMDKSGNGRNLLLTGADTVRPLYKTDGRYHWVEGDGTDDYLVAAFTCNQPFQRISAIRQLSWTTGDRIFSGGSAVAGLLQQTGTTPQFRLFSGTSTTDTVNGDAAVGADVVVTELHSGLTSRLGVNNGGYSVGSAGTTNPGGLALFAGSDGTSPSNARFYGGIMRAGIMTDVQIGNVRRYFATKAGVAL